MPAVRFFLVPKRLVRAHRALPAHSSRRFLQPSIATCGSTQFLSVIAFRPCMRTKFLFANLAINGFLFIASCAACELLFYWSPPAHFATDGLIRRRPNGLRVSRARFFCRCRFSPFAGMALFAAFRLPSGHTPVICPLFCAAFAPNVQCPRGIGRNCARPCRDVPRFYIESVLLKKAGRGKRKPRASGSAEARDSRFRVTTSMEV